MFNKIKNLFNKDPTIKIPVEIKPRLSIFSTDLPELPSRNQVINRAMNRTFMRTAKEDTVATPGVAMDSVDAMDNMITAGFSSLSNSTGIPDAQLNWYASQGFIGYQLCALLAQHWLIDKCCKMPAEDSVRKGYKVTVNSGDEIDAEIHDAIKRADVKYRLNTNLVQFINMGRVFGIRIAMFKVESKDPQYYQKPFNPDGITPGSYKGIVQIDPYWITPELDGEAGSDPSSMYFYEPTWWRINGRRYHRTHLIIFRNGDVPDILKPTYLYGGIPVPQKIYERVYAAERTANEAPQLAMTKRSTIMNVDLAQAISQQVSVEQRMQLWAYYRDNYGIKLIGLEEVAQQFDTSLTDLDAIIMTQYQIVAAAANVPATKLLGTTPKGFNATGEYEESSYHEELESIQAHNLTPLIERHHLLLIRSEISPLFKIEPFATSVVWNPLDTPTSEEIAALNKTKADTDTVLAMSGAIDGEDIRQRVINDPESGYSGLDDNDQSDLNSPDIDSEVLNDPEEGESEPTIGMKTDKTPGFTAQGG